ncbi:hypothetical protein PSEUBRA_002454 [Kalmanozyma brasiliensis GHG001]|uniref:uncharacterized protein n=1 Tax=Kalmanozyma brasiliensis (strain GHG001) TaxID=1365824 RepID=UPI001CEB2348|nr:uncharacterized protein PSEUBRA_002454 [Kalmanozyma brasiliensis GHG001]KAF6767087.1 hypothetical protein PSEUBRA_002454 [Kalmanozyma brasiliensis GHG001]
MVKSLLSKFLPLAEDPFPPTHKAGSEFEGFFIRLESHSGRSQTSSSSPAGSSSTRKAPKKSPASKASPSRIPRLTPKSRKAEASTSTSPLSRRRVRSSSTSSSSSSSSAAGPASPTPPSRKASREQPRRFADDRISPKSLFPEIEPVFASPESYLPRPTPPSSASKVRNLTSTLPTSSPGDLILVVCELQSAPVDQRICIYLRWIVHGEEPALHRELHSSNGAERLPKNARRKGESFEIVHHIPAWQVKLGAKVGSFAVQPFRIGLPELGFVDVKPDGNVVADITLPNPARGMGTRVRLRSTKFAPWQEASKLPMGSRGPEGWIQHLGPILPLHWYVHSSSAPAMFSLEHVAENNGEVELDNAVAAGRGLLHVEKNWGQAFPSGWMWAHGASALADPSFDSTSKERPFVRLSLAGGSILGLTAFLVGVHIKDTGSEVNWTFTPPFAVGPKVSFPSSKGEERVHIGPGLRMTRNFGAKQFRIDVWDLSRWASIYITGDEETFATQIPGPRRGGWTPGYCHHSYRCRASITLYKRSAGRLAMLPMKAVLNPLGTLRSGKRFLGGADESSDGWSRLGWQKVTEARLDDRVALEFGGDFAQ